MTQQEFFKRYKYSIRTDKVGGGAFGTVYKAFDEELNREVAIKVSQVKIMGGKEFSLKDEFDAIKNVPVHRNIANYEALYTFEGPQGIFDYAIMQFYKDGNLSSFIKSNPSTALKEQVAIDLLNGIIHLHKHSVVHRDLKPGNILIVKRGAKIIPVITDFGLSKNAKMEGQSRFSNSFGGGTLKYSSPEQLKAEKLRLNTDLWAYGVIVYEIFTGKNLFMAQQITGASAEAEKEIYEQIIGVDVSEMINELPGKWQEVVKQCLVRDGAKRIKSAEALKELILKGEMNTDSEASTKDDKTLISEVVSEESMNAQTIVNDKQTTEKEAVKKESVKKNQPKKAQPKQDKSFQSKQSFTESKKVENKKKPLILVGVIIGLLVISGFVYAMLPSENNDWETAKKQNTEQSFSVYLEKYPKGDFIEDAGEKLAWIRLDKNSSVNLKRFISENQQSDKKEIVEELLVRIEYDSVKSNGNALSYNFFIDKYPNFALSDSLKIALGNMEKREWNKTVKQNTIKAYNLYLNSFSQGEFRINAEKAISGLNKKEDEKNYLKGRSFSDKGDYKEAFKWYKKAADQNGADGLNGLGYLYMEGLGVTQNYKTAKYLFTKSANKGSSKAKVSLGYLYHYGKGVTQSYETAIKWYKKAANENWVSGQWNMGVMYENGYGVATNINTARYWWKKACDNGLEKACVRL